MFLRFSTKADRNGNVYRIEMDTDAKRLYFDSFVGAGDVIVTRKDLRKIIETARKDGYTDTVRL